MALAPLHPCPGSPTCPHRVRQGLCPVHALQKERTRYNRDVRKWYYTQRWKLLRQRVLLEQSHTCAEAGCGHVNLSLDVDHVVPHRGNPALFWDRANLRGLCHACHARKTGRGD